jgi:hypothetical protein
MSASRFLDRRHPFEGTRAAELADNSMIKRYHLGARPPLTAPKRELA